MKKLTVLLQIIGMLAVCPAYVVLEITHYAKEKSAVSADSSIKPITKTVSPEVSTVPASEPQSATFYLNAK